MMNWLAGMAGLAGVASSIHINSTVVFFSLVFIASLFILSI
jgi:hypothetical protein